MVDDALTRAVTIRHQQLIFRFVLDFTDVCDALPVGRKGDCAGNVAHQLTGGPTQSGHAVQIDVVPIRRIAMGVIEIARVGRESGVAKKTRLRAYDGDFAPGGHLLHLKTSLALALAIGNKPPVSRNAREVDNLAVFGKRPNHNVANINRRTMLPQQLENAKQRPYDQGHAQYTRNG